MLAKRFAFRGVARSMWRRRANSVSLAEMDSARGEGATTGGLGQRSGSRSTWLACGCVLEMGRRYELTSSAGWSSGGAGRAVDGSAAAKAPMSTSSPSGPRMRLIKRPKPDRPMGLTLNGNLEYLLEVVPRTCHWSRRKLVASRHELGNSRLKRAQQPTGVHADDDDKQLVGK